MTKWGMKLKNPKKGWIKSLLFGILFLIIYNIPFIHNEYKSVTKQNIYSTHYKEHKIIINTTNKNRDKLINNFEKGLVSKTQFINNLKGLELKKKIDLKEYFIKRKKIMDEYSFMGYSSFRYFLYAIGMPIFSIFPIILLLIFAYNPQYLKDFRRFYLIGSYGLIYVSSFWILHSVLVKSNFEQYLYTSSFYLLAIIPTILIFVFTSLFSRKQNKLKKGIQLLIKYISVDLYKQRGGAKEDLINDLNKYDELTSIIK